ncbi:MAG: hypothetical protein E7164_00375 [Firmicutes bacterium]|nr:hypothetical protein [Bacillota bacterium]
MNINKIVIYLTIISIVIIVGCPTFYKVIKENHRRLYLVTNKLIIEEAQRCYNQGVCKTNKVTLKMLYDEKYITEKVIDPVTKIVYDENSYVEIKEKDSTFYPQK